MPGIAGIIGRGLSPEPEAQLDRMVKQMMHQPFYRAGKHVDPRLGVWVGWACQAGSFGDCLPVWNEARNVVLFLTGEVTVDGRELDALRAAGHEFQPGNATFLVHQYEQRGLDFLSGLNGWFAGLLIDLRQGLAVLFNDRYGMERLYLHETDRGIFFASEAKCLLKVLPQTRGLQPDSLAELLTCSCVLQNRTLFPGIALLPGASQWSFYPDGSSHKARYFNPETWEQQPQLSPQAYYETLKATWQRILPRYTPHGQRMALSLTGGVDSRMILAWLNPAPGTLPCYTWGSRYRDCYDVRLGRQLAGLCGQSHQIIPLDQSFLSDFPSLAEKAVYISDGCRDVAGAVDVYFQRMAREIAPVRLSGGYGNELLRGKVAFKPGALDSKLFKPDLLRASTQAGATYAEELRGHRVSVSAFKQAPWYAFSSFSVERALIVLRTPYLDNDLVAVAYQAPPQCLDIHLPLRLIGEGNPAFARVWTDRGFNLQPSPLAKRVRRWYQEFTFKAEYAYDGGMPQWLARVDGTLAPLHLEKLFLGRHKTDHFRVWFRDELAGFVQDVLLDPRTLGRPYWEPAEVKRVVESHLEGSGNFTGLIRQLLTIELIHRLLLEQN